MKGKMTGVSACACFLSLFFFFFFNHFSRFGVRVWGLGDDGAMSECMGFLTSPA
jgi:hypothetical protein